MAKEPPAAESKVIVWLDAHPKAIQLLHAARQRARASRSAWAVAYVQTPSRSFDADRDLKEHMLRLCTIAEQMGGEVLNLQADTVEKGLTALLEAEKGRIYLFIIGSYGVRRWWNFAYLRRLRWQQIVRIVSPFTRVEIIALGGPLFNAMDWRNMRVPRVNPFHLLYALAAVAAAYGVAELLKSALPPALFRINAQNISLLFMTACAFVAGGYGLAPGLVAALASALIYNYFYTVPYYELEIVSISEALNMLIFLLAALLVALFTSRARSYAENVAKRERATQSLFTLYRIASTASSRQQLLETLQRKLTQMLDAEVAFFLPPALNPDRIEAAVPKDPVLVGEDQAALLACWNEMQITGVASPLHAGAAWRFEPLIAPGGEIGVLGVRLQPGRRLDMWLGNLLTNVADQTAVLIEHVELERSMEATRIREEREKLRSMLLSSVSHDLKTPLAGIIGSLSVYRSVGKRLTEARRNELLEGALEEAQRLDSFITNILEMTRLESGHVDFRPEWHDVPTVLQQVVKRMQHRFRERDLHIETGPDDIAVYMDIMMTQQVFQNLLDNVCKYTPDGTRVDIACGPQEQGYVCTIRDHGRGFPKESLLRIFDKYTRLQKEDSQVAGTGLGLAICKAIMEAQGGWITAANHEEGGAVFTFCLPKWREKSTYPGQEEAA